MTPSSSTIFYSTSATGFVAMDTGRTPRRVSGWRSCSRAHEQTLLHHLKEFNMSKRIWVVAVAASLAAAIAYAQQYPVMERIADKVIEKYQTATCEQLWQEKAQGQGKPKPEMQQRAVQMLKQDPQMRQAFFNKVAAPIVNKMFECGMIP
jgi:hypothetical protein